MDEELWRSHIQDHGSHVSVRHGSLAGYTVLVRTHNTPGIPWEGGGALEVRKVLGILELLGKGQCSWLMRRSPHCGPNRLPQPRWSLMRGASQFLRPTMNLLVMLAIPAVVWRRSLATPTLTWLKAMSLAKT